MHSKEQHELKIMQTGFFDLEDRHKKLEERDPLVRLNELIDWESFRSTLELATTTEKKNNAGRKPFDCVMMFKALILQHLYNISDDELEYQIRDRYSFCRFLGRLPENRIPDAKTIWLFRERLTNANVVKDLFDDFEFQLQDKGFKARKGQIVDASFVEAPRQRNTREENADIKTGKRPAKFDENPNVGRQKDVDARWTKKNDETHYGYKNHISIDNENKIIREFEVTSAEVHDSNVLSDLLTENSSKDIWGDSAYRSEATEMELKASGFRSHVHTKGTRNRPLSDARKKANTKRSKVRARVEHVFGSIKNEQGGLFVRSIGLARAKTKVTLINLVYNMRRFITLSRIVAPSD